MKIETKMIGAPFVVALLFLGLFFLAEEPGLVSAETLTVQLGQGRGTGEEIALSSSSIEQTTQIDTFNTSSTTEYCPSNYVTGASMGTDTTNFVLKNASAYTVRVQVKLNEMKAYIDNNSNNQYDSGEKYIELTTAIGGSASGDKVGEGVLKLYYQEFAAGSAEADTFSTNYYGTDGASYTLSTSYANVDLDDDGDDTDTSDDVMATNEIMEFYFVFSTPNVVVDAGTYEFVVYWQMIAVA